MLLATLGVALLAAWAPIRMVCPSRAYFIASEWTLVTRGHWDLHGQCLLNALHQDGLLGAVLLGVGVAAQLFALHPSAQQHVADTTLGALFSKIDGERFREGVAALESSTALGGLAGKIAGQTDLMNWPATLKEIFAKVPGGRESYRRIEAKFAEEI